MLVKKAPDIPSSEITDKKLYLRRREFIQAAAVTAVGAAAGTLGLGTAEAATWPRITIPNVQKASSPALTTTDKPNSYQDITTYNNFYEFGTDQGRPVEQRRIAENEAVDGENRRDGHQARRLSA